MDKMIDILLNYLAQIISIIVGLIAIYSFYRSIKKQETRENGDSGGKINLKLSLLLSAGVILVILGFFFLFEHGEAESLKEKEQIRWDFVQIQNTFQYDVLAPFSKMIDTTYPGPVKDETVLKIAHRLFNKLKNIPDNKLNLSLSIFKYDNLAYITLVISSFEQENNNKVAFNWADKCIVHVQHTLVLIDSLYGLDQDEDKEKLTLWVSNDDFVNRNHFLWAWALAIKINNISVLSAELNEKRIENIEKNLRDDLLEQLNLIDNGKYKNKYQKNNKDFQKLRRKFPE
jgi:hypothetical protein